MCIRSHRFQCLNNNNTSDTYFYNIQTRISTILKIEQQYLNTITKRALRVLLKQFILVKIYHLIGMVAYITKIIKILLILIFLNILSKFLFLSQ